LPALNQVKGKHFGKEVVLNIKLPKFYDSKPLEFYTFYRGIHDIPRCGAEVMITKGKYILDK
jgi:hypothetical protein